MIVAASTACIPTTPLPDILDRLADLEYTNAELVIGEQGTILPSEIASQHDLIVHTCKISRRITPVAIFLDVDPTTPNFFEIFRSACLLAKALKVVVMTIHAMELGTPFNEEVERLRQLVRLAMSCGVVLGVLTENGRLTESPDTVGSLCKSVKGLSVTLDPSHYIFGQPKMRDFDAILGSVCHVRLRDTSPQQFQIRVGQGVLEFGRLVIQLTKVDYRKALCVDIATQPDLDTAAELRKMRLLLESLL